MQQHDEQPEWEMIYRLLNQPFGPMERTVTKNGGTWHYLRYEDILDRLDEVVGMGNWEETPPRLMDAAACALEIGIVIHGRARYDVGYPNHPVGATVVDKKTGKEKRIDSSEPLKEAYKDAFRRCAVKWGVGRYLDAKNKGLRRGEPPPTPPAGRGQDEGPSAAAPPASPPAPSAEEEPPEGEREQAQRKLLGHQVSAAIDIICAQTKLGREEVTQGAKERCGWERARPSGSLSTEELSVLLDRLLDWRAELEQH